MKKAEIKIGMTVEMSGRNAEVLAIKGNDVKVRPAGESSRWVKISDLKKID
jgi:hypothetical protein